MRILVACDLTSRSDRAIARGFQLAKDLGGSLDIVHVVDDALTDSYRTHAVDWAKKALTEQIAEFSQKTGVSAQAHVRVGNPRTDVAAAADEAGAELIIIGVHGDRPVGSKAFSETSAGKLLKSTLHAVLLVRDEVEETYRNVVVGVDFSMFTRAALHQALTFAPSARFHLVHAYHLPFAGLARGDNFNNQVAYEERLKLDAFLAEEMERVGERARQIGLMPGEMETLMREGDARHVLREVCGSVDADLMVIGTHSRSGLSRAIWGSVAADVLNSPPCDVLVIKPY
jgi:nucleotide-binding universal stress UspA family protein